jgi:hypothetical protein
MRLRLFSALALPVLSLVAISAVGAQKEQRYSSLQVDAKGQLHIFTDSGREIVPARIKSQVSFGKPAISPDHLMVGWMVEYDDSDAIGVPYDSIAGDLVLFCNGQVVQRFHAEQLLWDWKFVEGGNGWHTPRGLCMGIRPNACCVMFNPDASLSGGFSTRKLNFPRGLAESDATAPESTVHYTLSKCLKPPVPRSMNEKSMKL